MRSDMENPPEGGIPRRVESRCYKDNAENSKPMDLAAQDALGDDLLEDEDEGLFGFETCERGAEWRTAVAFVEWGLRIVPVGDRDCKREIDSPCDATRYYAERTRDFPPFKKRAPSWPAIVLQCVCVLEVQPEAVDTMRALIARHRLPKGAAITKTRGGVWQIWFVLHSGWRIGDNRLPESMRLKYWGAPTVEDATAEAPSKFDENFPERLFNVDFPEPPFWLRELAGIRKKPVDWVLRRTIRAALAAHKSKHREVA